MKLTINYEKSKFLIIRFSSIGDIILSTPIIQGIREQFPNAEIHFAVNDVFAKIIENNPFLDSIIPYHKHITKKALAEQKKMIIDKYSGFDYIIDLQNNHRSRSLRKGLSDKIYSIDKRRLYKLMLVHCKKKIAEPIHATDNYFNCIQDILPTRNYKQYVNIDPNIKISDYFSDIDNHSNNNNSKKNIILAPGSAHFTKQFPAEKFIEIIKHLENNDNSNSSNYNIILIGGKSERQICEEIARKSGKEILNLCGELELNETAAIIAQSDLIICNDSGVMHIAAACDIPIIAIFGSSVKDLGFTPLSAQATIIENNGLKCRPCSHIGREKCPRGHFRCMRDIDIKKILDKIDSLLSD